MTPSLLLTLSLFAVPAIAQDAGEDPPAAIVDVTAAAGLLEKGDWKGAAAASEEILSDASQVDAHAAAWGYLGAALHKGGLPYAGLSAWGEGLEVAPIALTPHYQRLVDTAATLNEDVWIGGLLSDMSVPMAPAVREHVAIMVARHAFDESSWGEVLGILPLVPETSRYALEAEVLNGVTLAQQSRFGESLAALLAARERAVRGNRSPHYVATLSLNVARTFYASGNFGRAMEYYNMVGREDAYWPQAHFERAWAHFSVDDMAGTLALLHTHHSPFFEGWYFPEAELVRAQALYLMCKFPEAKNTIDFFQEKYEPLHESLVGTVGQLDAATAFDDGRDMLAGKPTQLPSSLMRKLTWDQRFQDSAAAIDLADAELARIDGLGDDAWVIRARKTLTGRRDARVKAEGSRILDIAREARDELDDMLEGIELTRIDLLTFEADLLSRAAATGEMPEFGDKIGKIRKLRRKGKRVWPFEGEYWADELGWYSIDARPDCPNNLRRGEAK